MFFPFILADKVKNQIFNVSSDNIQILELAKIIQKKIKNTKINVDDKKIDERNYTTSSKKIREAVGWKSKHTIESFIDDMIKDINNGKWCNYSHAVFDNYKYLKAMGLAELD